MFNFLKALFGSGVGTKGAESAIAGNVIGDVQGLALDGVGQMAQLTGQGAPGVVDLLTQASVPTQGSSFLDFLSRKQMQMAMDIINAKQGSPMGLMNRSM